MRLREVIANLFRQSGFDVSFASSDSFEYQLYGISFQKVRGTKYANGKKYILVQNVTKEGEEHPEQVIDSFRRSLFNFNAKI